MSIAVVVVNFNSGVLLAKCLRHLERQTLQPEQVFVVDNASTDNSAACTSEFAGVTLLDMNRNVGFAAGNNAALSLCDTDFVVLLNPDAFPEPDWLEHLLNAATTNPDYSMFGSLQVCYEKPKILDGIGDSYFISGRVLRKLHGVPLKADKLESVEIFSPCAAAALYRRQALAEVDGFDDDYFCYVEDIDLGFRLRLAGHKAMFVPDAVVRHMGSAVTGGQHSDFSVYHGHRNLVWTYVKNMPGILFWLLLPLHLLLNVVTLMWFFFHGQAAVILQSKMDAIKGLPIMWTKRHQIQIARKTTVINIWRALDKRLFTI